MTAKQPIHDRDLTYATPDELVRLVLKGGPHSAQALEELRTRALFAPFPFKATGTM